MLTSTRLTYKEWQAKGFQVQKGQTHTGRNANGECTFLFTQVKQLQPIKAPAKKQAQSVFDSITSIGMDDDGDVYWEEEMSFRDSDYMQDMGDRD